jgi:hypothetical protein
VNRAEPISTQIAHVRRTAVIGSSLTTQVIVAERTIASNRSNYRFVQSEVANRPAPTDGSGGGRRQGGSRVGCIRVGAFVGGAGLQRHLLDDGLVHPGERRAAPTATTGDATVALVLMIGSAYLILGVVAHRQLFAMIEPRP